MRAKRLSLACSLFMMHCRWNVKSGWRLGWGVHDYVWNFENNHTDRPPLTDEQKAKTPIVSHPAVRTHPENKRKALYISDVFVSHFEGEDYNESRALVKELMDFASQSCFEYVHRWTPGDVIIWDNRACFTKPYLLMKKFSPSNASYYNPR